MPLRSRPRDGLCPDSDACPTSCRPRRAALLLPTSTQTSHPETHPPSAFFVALHATTSPAGCSFANIASVLAETHSSTASLQCPFVQSTGVAVARLYCHGADLQRSHPAHRSSLVFCHSSGISDRHRHGFQSNHKSLHRILRGQAPGATARRIRHRSHSLRFCPTIPSILAGAVRCARRRLLPSRIFCAIASKF
jgi:hypothetical protein